MSHPSFTPLTLNEIKKEIDGGIERLKSVIDYDIRLFCIQKGPCHCASRRQNDSQHGYDFSPVLHKSNPSFELLCFAAFLTFAYISASSIDFDCFKARDISFTEVLSISEYSP